MYGGGSSSPYHSFHWCLLNLAPAKWPNTASWSTSSKLNLLLAQFISLLSLSPVRSLLTWYSRKSFIHAIFLNLILAPQAADLSSPPGLSLSYNQQSQCRISHVPLTESRPWTVFYDFISDVFFPLLLKLDDLSPQNLDGWRLQRLPTASGSIQT